MEGKGDSDLRGRDRDEFAARRARDHDCTQAYARGQKWARERATAHELDALDAWLKWTGRLNVPAFGNSRFADRTPDVEFVSVVSSLAEVTSDEVRDFWCAQGFVESPNNQEVVDAFARGARDVSITG